MKAIISESKTEQGKLKQTGELEPVLNNSSEGPAFLANLIASHIIQGLPIYRQEAYFEMALDKIIPRKTLYNSELRAIEAYLWPLYLEMCKDIQKAPLIQADETYHKCIEISHSGGNSKSTIVAAATQDHFPFPICLFNFRADKKIEFIDELVGPDYQGCLQKDGYPKSMAESDKIQFNSIAGGCLIHARRYFMKVEESRAVCKELKRNKITDKAAKAKAIEEARKQDYVLDRTEEILDLFSHIFRLEKKLDRTGADDLTIYTVRNSETKALLEALDERIEELSKKASTTHAVKQACTYYFNNKACLWHFLVDPSYKVDTSFIERQIRCFALFRKNSLFNTSERGARLICAAMSVLRTAMLNGLNPWAYLEWLFKELRSKRHYITGQIPADQVRKHLPYSPYVPECLKLENPRYKDGVFEQKLRQHPDLAAVRRPDNPLAVEFFDPFNPLYDVIPLPMGLTREDLLKNQLCDPAALKKERNN